MSKIICFCFGYTLPDIERDALAHGRSTLLECILASHAAGACRCAEANPKGR